MESKNLLIAILLSVAIMVGFQFAYEGPRRETQRQEAFVEKIAKEATLKTEVEVPAAKDRAALLAEAKRVKIETPEIKGSLRLKGARLDDLELKNYTTNVDPKADRVVLLAPSGATGAYYADFGWLGEGTPTAETEWKADAAELTPEKPLHLTWNNGKGLIFERTIAVDKDFLFTITDRVKNESGADITLYPFGLVARHDAGQHASYDLEGPLGVFNGRLTEYNFKDMAEEGRKAFESDGGWLGMGDKYWLVALVPPQSAKLATTFTFKSDGVKEHPQQGLFQTDFRGTGISVAAGATTEQTLRLFAGAKRVRLFDAYTDSLNLPHFDRAIDFGWFYFLTKPFLYLLDYLGVAFGNYGLSILALTVLLKILTYPLSAKSYKSMAKMKVLQPEIKKIQERYKEDQQKMAAETMALYKRENTNPMSGCLPVFIQIPIFFALYKVLSVSIELRHAPFYGWIHDLAAADPTSVWNLFGLLAFHPSFLPAIGAWPLLMGITMYLQQALSPQPPDATQARIFRFLPILFTFMMAQVAAGLVIYWTLSNVLGLAQQWIIMHRHGEKK